MRVILLCMLMAGCSYLPITQTEKPPVASDVVDTAEEFYGYTERSNRRELAALMDVDPVSVQWCAAFVNAVLDNHDIPGSDTVSQHPLVARSFLSWGVAVDEPQPGDIAIFPRGQAWQGHVGFYVSTVYRDGEKWYWILGGNQDNSVSYKLYPARQTIGIRRLSL